MKYRIWRTGLAGLIAAAASTLAVAAPAETAGAPVPAAAAPAVAGVEPLTVVLALLLVVVLIIALGWLVRRSGVALGGGAGRVLASLPLGGRERAVLIDIGGEQLLLGVAPGQVRLLVRFDAPVVDTAPAPGEFAARLKQWLEPGRRE